MGRKIQSIYEYFSEFSEQEIDDMIFDLSMPEKLLIRDRYGDDLHNPVRSTAFTVEKKGRFYSYLLPKMKRLLVSRHAAIVEPEEEETKVEEVKVEEPKEDIDLTAKLFELVKKRKTNREICETLHIDSSQLYSMLLNLRNNGMFISRRYYSDGSILYRPATNFAEIKKMSIYEQDRTIITDPKEDFIKSVVFADPHFGNELEGKALLDKMFNYCIKNGIHIVLCGGDLIDGAYTKGTQTIPELYKQIEYFIKNYPSDKSILTFSVGGDHDLSAIAAEGLSIMEACNNLRHDIIIGGYNNCGINIQNDQILLTHHIDGGYHRSTSAPLILHGHLHSYKTYFKDNSLNITIPSLSSINQPMPTILEIGINLNKGFFETSYVKQIYLGEQDIVLGEFTYDLSANRTLPSEPLKNTESYKIASTEKKEPQPVKKLTPMSQVDKFNKRYGL